MSVDALIKALTTGLEENTAEAKALKAEVSALRAAMGGSAPAASTASKPAAAAAEKPAAAGKKAAPKSKYTLEQVVAKAVELKDVIGRDETVKFVSLYGAKSSKDLKPEIWDQFVEDVDARIADEQGGEEVAGDDDV